MAYKRTVLARTLSLLSRPAYPGKYRLYSMLRDRGVLSGHMFQRAGSRVFCVPASEWVYWKRWYGREDMRNRLEHLTHSLRPDQPYTLIDVGANIGIAPVHLTELFEGVTEIYAFEPNRRALPYLEENLATTGARIHLIPSAASNFDGTARLVVDSDRVADESAHLGQGDGGDAVSVVRIDSACPVTEPNVVLKVDAEGHEKQVIEGASRTLGACRHAVLFVEIHPLVIRRTGVSAEQIFEAAEAFRNFTWHLPEEGLPPVDRTRPFFDQFSDENVYDVVGIAG